MTLKQAVDEVLIRMGQHRTAINLDWDTVAMFVNRAIRETLTKTLPYKEWCYFPIPINRKTTEQKALIMIVKLNRYADSPFRFEIFKDQADNMTEKDSVELIRKLSKIGMVPGFRNYFRCPNNILLVNKALFA